MRRRIEGAIKVKYGSVEEMGMRDDAINISS